MIEIMRNEISQLFDKGIRNAFTAAEPLFHNGDEVASMYFVTSGRVELTRHTGTGGKLSLQIAQAGDVLAEASAYSDVYHCDAHASIDSTVVSVSVAEFRRRLDRNREAANDWAAHLARAVHLARMRAEIRTVRTVAERLDTWIRVTGTIPMRGTWTTLASELGVSREALYRELAKRRR